ncbi:hypothetical protein DITRI_Ditri01bG0155000 [Diplodiscus trichospermus]
MRKKKMPEHLPVEVILEVLRRLPVKSLLKCRTNDYKLLIVVVEETLGEAYLFSLNENSWKRVTAISPRYAVEDEMSSTFVNGATHWVGYQRGKDSGYRNTILVLKSDWEGGEQLDVWVMKEYGVVVSWTKLCFTEQSGRIPWVLGFRKDAEVLLEVDSGEMASLDLNCQQKEHLGIEAKRRCSFVDSHVESLVLLDKAVDPHSE